MNTNDKRLWDQGASLDESVHRFTVGDDAVWDRHLVHWDCLGSAAHVRTLAEAGLLSAAEQTELLAGLAEIDARARAGRFEIPVELEDGHTALEAQLTAKCAAAGEKIHAGRSRNDQVATALRLFMRHHAFEWLDGLAAFAHTVLERIDRNGATPMPGYTHMQRAMPSSVGQWLHAYVEAALEQMRAVFDLLNRLDYCPLGTGAGFGVPLPIDRQYTAELLGFTNVQRSPIDVQNSRGRLEKYCTRVAADIAAMIEKWACDLLLFSTAEFGFFSLPGELTTGSSIMPQKRNPDALELLRAHGGRAAARAAEIQAICTKLPSGYHRDLQMTKPPMMQATLDTLPGLGVAVRVTARFLIHEGRMRAAMTPELFATHAALALVREGVPFRQAYRRIAEDVSAGRFDENAAAAWREGAGLVEAGSIAEARAELEELNTGTRKWRERVQAAERSLLPDVT